MDAQGLRDALASQCPTFKPRAIDVGELSKRDGDIKAVTEYLRGVQTKSKCVERQGTKTIRTGLFLLHAVKGGGKTVFLKKIAADHAVHNDDGGAGIFVTYNGGDAVYPITPWDELRCFAVQLLLSQGVPAKIAERVKNLDVALEFMREAKYLSPSAPLTICVDEIAALDGQKVALGPWYDPAQATIRALMGYQDAVTNEGTHGRAYFIFSALIASYADNQPGSGRIIWKHGLKKLTRGRRVAPVR